MNIFYLSSDPIACAEWMVDRHVVKMILETAQLLSTAHRILDGIEQTIKVPTKSGKCRNKKFWVLKGPRNTELYSATHINHPCAVWARQSSGNYNWLWRHLVALCAEYSYRYGKVHKVATSGLLYTLKYPPKNIKDGIFYLPPSCMDTKYQISDNPVANYRNYYKYGKTHLHKWKKREVPAWISGDNLCLTIPSKTK